MRLTSWSIWTMGTLWGLPIQEKSSMPVWLVVGKVLLWSYVSAVEMVFMNKDRQYPIRGIRDTVEWLYYRTGPKVLMDTNVIPQWISERRVFKRASKNPGVVFNFSTNSIDTATTRFFKTMLREINTEVMYFPPNPTHLFQSCNTFVTNI